jgi:amino acid adenylation domain-containing protein
VEAQVALTPDAIAIDHGGTTLRYDALNRRANRLARRLIGAGAAPERLIGICMDRSIDMVVAVLATLKAGAGFVPLDPAFPIDRLHAIARDANLLAVITQDKHALALESLPCQLLLVAADKVDATRADEMNLDVAVSADSLAYVFYTSGSTGAPKGVMLDHRCAMNRLEWLRRRYTLAVGDRLIYKTPLVFDVAVWEILGPLMAGATILMADDGAQADVMHIAALLTVPRTVFTHFVPSMLDAYLGAAPPTACPDLRWVSLSGEAVATRVLKRFSEHFAAEFHNLYGQTETSEVAGWEGRVPPSATTVPIGRQIGIYRLYILDAALNPVPPGVPGEICVAGVGGLARGYQGQPMLTAEKFVPNPYAVVPGERLYRTGDVGRLAEDGTIAYVGRTDHQVKVRGCRVEPAEVEAVLCLHSSVRSCAVVARHDPDGDIQLVAYVVGDAPSEAELGRHVEKYLPRYMVPSAFIILDALPVTPSGKLDRLRLPAPRAMHFAARSKAEPPQTPLETRLAAIWQDVLGIEGIGRGDPFFSIGGNSLKSIQVISRVIAEFNVNVRVSEFWAAPTVEGLASLVEQALMTYVASLSEDEANELLNDRLAEGVGHA